MEIECYSTAPDDKIYCHFCYCAKNAKPREVDVVEISGPKRLSNIFFDAREVAARIYAAMRRAGIKAIYARFYVQAAILNVSKRTLRDWVTRLKSEGHLFSREKEIGWPKFIHDDKIRILVVWILRMRDSRTIVRIRDPLLFLTKKIEYRGI